MQLQSQTVYVKRLPNWSIDTRNRSNLLELKQVTNRYVYGIQRIFLHHHDII